MSPLKMLENRNEYTLSDARLDLVAFLPFNEEHVSFLGRCDSMASEVKLMWSTFLSSLIHTDFKEQPRRSAVRSSTLVSVKMKTSEVWEVYR